MSVALNAPVTVRPSRRVAGVGGSRTNFPFRGSIREPNSEATGSTSSTGTMAKVTANPCGLEAVCSACGPWRTTSPASMSCPHHLECLAVATLTASTSSLITLVDVNAKPTETEVAAIQPAAAVDTNVVLSVPCVCTALISTPRTALSYCPDPCTRTGRSASACSLSCSTAAVKFHPQVENKDIHGWPDS